MKKRHIFFTTLIILGILIICLTSCSNNGNTKIESIDATKVQGKYDVIALNKDAPGGKYYLLTVSKDVTNIKFTNYIKNEETGEEEATNSVYVNEDILSKTNKFVIQGVLDSPLEWHQYRMVVYSPSNPAVYNLNLSDNGIVSLEKIDSEIT